MLPGKKKSEICVRKWMPGNKPSVLWSVNIRDRNFRRRLNIDCCKVCTAILLWQDDSIEFTIISPFAVRGA